MKPAVPVILAVALCAHAQAQTGTIEQQERDFQKRHQQREAEWDKRFARQREAAEKKKQRDAQLRKDCASARARIGRLHAERRTSADKNRHIPEIERLGRFVDTQCPPE